ncbi:MAG TPA: hypothetical protein VGI95_18590 [Caulobacteraceae bacterium]|jgi:hypothetical protein
MADSDLTLTFSADTGGLTQGLAEAKAAMGDFSPVIAEVRKSLQQVGDHLKTLGGARDLERLKTSMDGVVSTFSRGLAQMITGSRSLSQVMRSVGLQILNDLFKVVDGVVDKWAWGVTQNVLASTQGQALLSALGLKGLAAEVANAHAGTIATLAGVNANVAAKRAGAVQGLAISGEAGMKDIVNAAAQAAGNAYNAMSGIPVVGPILGAAAAATVFGAVMAFKGLISSAAGGFDIPAGVNPLTQLHAQEMVLPARLANPMRSMLADYQTGGAGVSAPSSSAASGDLHAHFHINGDMDGPSFKTFLRANQDHLSTVLQEMGRKGMRTA